MRVGASETDITPPVGGWLLGRMGPSTGVHEPLYARALVADDGNQPWIVIGMDLVGLSIEFSHELRATIRAATGIETVLLNCSHNHSAPFSMPWSIGGWQQHLRDEVGWRDHLRAVLPDLAQAAADKMVHVQLRVGRAPVQVGVNRRLNTDDGVIMAPNREGPQIPWVDVLAAYDDKGSPVAVLFSHAAHPVIVHNTSSLICADFPGAAVTHIRTALGADVVPLFVQGCGGDINGHPLRAGHEAAKEAGNRLGEATLDALEQSVALQETTCRLGTTTVWLSCEDLPTAAECGQALGRATTRLQESAGDPERHWILEDRIHCLRELQEMIDANRPPRIPLEINVIVLGYNWCLLTAPHELFCEYGLWFDREFPFRHTMSCAYTNGCEAYIPTDKDLEMGPKGGYEASSFASAKSAGLVYRNRLALRAGIEVQIKESVAKLVEEVVGANDR